MAPLPRTIYSAILVLRHCGTTDEIARAVGIFSTLQEGMEETFRALLRKVALEEVADSLATGSVHRPLLSYESPEKDQAELNSWHQPSCCGKLEVRQSALVVVPCLLHRHFGAR